MPTSPQGTERHGRRVAAFYRFGAIEDVFTLRDGIERSCLEADVRGTVLIAEEGINGALVGERADLEDIVRRHVPSADVRWSGVRDDNIAFRRLRVRIKPEIVSFDMPLGRGERVGRHVGAHEWNELLAADDVMVVDVRNHYETKAGTFPGARAANTASFREFPDFLERSLAGEQHRRIAMFCTGGIRCEKASAWMLQRGFDEVYQLRGGILGYLAEVEEDANAFDGDCFVFDQRITVTKDLEQGDYRQCHACRSPVSRAEAASNAFKEGAYCPACHRPGDG